jgi:hypothetical protein
MAQFVIPSETGGCDTECAEAEGEPNISQSMRLFELERVEVVGNSIVGRVLEVCITKSHRVRSSSRIRRSMDW